MDSRNKQRRTTKAKLAWTGCKEPGCYYKSWPIQDEPCLAYPNPAWPTFTNLAARNFLPKRPNHLKRTPNKMKFGTEVEGDQEDIPEDQS